MNNTNLDRMNQIKALIEEELTENASKVDTACECDVRILNFKYNIKNTINAVINLASRQNEGKCTCGNCSNEECSCKKSE